MPRAIVSVALLGTTLLGTVATTSADVAPHHVPWLTVDVQVIASGTDAPRSEQAHAALAARRSASTFLDRVERCLRDRGATVEAPVSARLEYDRAVLPARTRILEGRGPMRACVAEVLPSIALADAPHGRVLLEITFTRSHVRW